MPGFNRKAWDRKAKERESRGGSFSNSSFAKPPKGVSYWKLLPRKGSDNPVYDPLLYFGYKKPDGSFTVYRGLNEDCPLLGRYKKLKKNGKDKLANKYKPKRVYHYNAVNAKTGELVVLQLGQTVQDEIDESFEDKPSTFNPFDPKNPYVLKVKRKGTTWNNTKYRAVFVKLSDFELPEDIDIDNLSSLEDIHETFTREELLALIKGEPPKSKRGKKEKGDEEEEEKDLEEEVEEDEDIEEENDEEDEEESGDEDLEEEDDDEDIEDDEEFEKAKKELENEL